MVDPYDYMSVDDLNEQGAMEQERYMEEIEMKNMPVLRAPEGCVKEVPFSMLCENQAQNNHWQSLDRLCERGGLSVCEMLAIIQKREWHRMDQKLAVKELNELLYVPKQEKPE